MDMYMEPLAGRLFPDPWEMGSLSDQNCSKPALGGDTERYISSIEDSRMSSAARRINNSSPIVLQFQNPDSSNGYVVGRELKPKEEKEIKLINRGGVKHFDRGARPISTHAQEHIMAERKRREKLTQLFIELSAVIPRLKKMDKASILSDAIKYVKELQDMVKHLEEQNVKRTVEPAAAFIKKTPIIAADDDNSSSGGDNSGGHEPSQPLPEVEVSVSERSVLVRITCKNHKGVVVKVLEEIEKLHLTITSTSMVPFPASSLHITITAEIDEQLSMTANDLAKKLGLAFNQFM